MDDPSTRGVDHLLLRIAELEEELARHRQGTMPVPDPQFILRQLAEGVILADADGRITFVNDAAERLHGAALIGVGPDDYSAAYQLFTEDGRPYPPDELPLARAVRNHERVTGARWRIRRPDGVEVLAVGSARPILDADGKRLGAVLTIRDDTPRLEAEAALRASEEFSRRVLASSPDCIKILTLDGQLELMTEGGMCVMEVEDFEAIRNVYWPDMWNGDERVQAVEAVQAARNGGAARFQGFATTLKGSPRWWDVTVSPINGADGRPEKLLSVSRDITPIKEAESVLRASEERLRETSRRLNAIISNTKMAVFLMDHRQHCIFANPAAEALTGYSFADMQGRPLHDVIHHKRPDGSHYPLEECPIDRAYPARAHTQGEELFVAPDGSFYPVAFTASPVLDDTGNPMGTVIEAHDIREEKARDEAIRQLNVTLERRVAEAIADRDRTWNNSRDLLLVIDQGGVIRAANPAWTMILGWKNDELVGHSFREFILEDDLAPSERALAHATQRELRSFENRYRHKNGGIRWISWVAAPEENLIYASGRDVTEEKEREAALLETQEALRQSQKMEAIGQLTGGIAHDFNNLLTGVIGSLDMMQRRISQGQTDRIERYTSAALTSANRAAALTHRLLAFARRQPLDPKPVNANRLVMDIEDLLRRTIGEAVRLEMVTAGGLWQTLCDPHQLESAIVNLAINARDAMPSGGTLTIETCNAHLDDAYAAEQRDIKPGQYICICVSDTGTGMTPDVVQRAFDPFFTTKDVGQGTGLGLSMVYGFTRQSEGYARIYSEEGQGTTVKLYLPRYYGEPDRSVREQAEISDEHKARHGETVLVVEDEDAVRALIVDVLEELGYNAIEATDGLAGLKVLQSDAKIDLVVTDVGLPGLNGRDLAGAARELRPGLKILFITGYAENAAIAAGFLEPGMRMITKPFAIETLATRIKDMIEES